MNPIIHFTGAIPLAEVASAPATGGLDTGTVVLALLVVAVMWLASSVMSLRNELEALKDTGPVRARPAPSPSAGGTGASGPTPAEIAAIAAAVHQVLGAGARVVAVVPPGSDGQAWSREGRREVFQSHQIR